MTSVVRQVSQLCLHVDHVSTSKSSLLAAFSKRKDVELISGEAPARTSYLRYDLHACFLPYYSWLVYVTSVRVSVGPSNSSRGVGGAGTGTGTAHGWMSQQKQPKASACQRSSKNRAFPFNLKTTFVLGLQKNYPLQLTHKNTIWHVSV